MFKVGLKGLLAHKRRLIGTCSAVLLGVAFLAGTLVLGDTMRAGFAEVFTQANKNVDVIVRGASEAETPGFSQRQNVPLDLQDTLSSVDGVAEAVPEISGLAEILGADGEPLGGMGPPTLAAAWTDSITNPYRISEGRAPEASGEVVINKGAAETGKLTVGSTTTVRVPDPIQVTIVGLASFGDADSLAGVTFTGFTFDDAQKYFIGNTDQVTDFLLRADSGVTQDELQTRVQSVLPSGVEAITGTESTKELQSDINDAFLGIFERFLLIFTLIALLVASFSIYNTFSVILAQRTRESALLRAIGASRRQVLSAMAFEAVIIGVISSVLGVLAGILLASGLKSALDAAGFGLPSGAVEIKPNSIIIAFVVGLVVTILASLVPSLRASGVPPLAAIREVAVDRASSSRSRAIIGTVFGVIGVLLVFVAGFGRGQIAAAIFGSLLCLVAMVVLGPLAAKPAGNVIGTLIQSIRGLPGRLARENAVRNPKRTSSTAAALMVGIAIVTLFTVFGASLKASFNDVFAGSFNGDLVIINNAPGAVGFSPDLTAQVAALPEVEHAAGITTGLADIDGKQVIFTASDPAQLGAVLDPEIISGSLTDLTDDQIAVSEDLATSRGWTMGQTLPISFIDGSTGELTVGGIYKRAELTGEAVVPIAVWAPHAPQLADQGLLIGLAPGTTTEQGKAAVQPLAEKYGAPDVQDRQEFIDTQAGQIDFLLNIVYVLLALSILIAVMGIANTLALSIYERTRELGLLRAVGETRSQLRSMVRWESAIIALFGTFGGLVLGLFLGWGLVKAVTSSLDFGGFSVPPSQLIVIFVVGGVFGVLAGVLPARRAAKLNILDSIATD